jgi:hypothetical protein
VSTTDDELPPQKPGDEIADDQPKAPGPALHVVKDKRGGPGRNGGKGQFGPGRRPPRNPDTEITPAKYDRALEAYLHGTRTYNGLARYMGISRGTAKRMIDRGYPLKRMASLKDRAEIYDKQVEAEHAKRAKISPQQLDEMGRWTQMREENLNVGRALRALLSKAANKVNEAVASAVSTRSVVVQKVVQIKGRGGKMIDRVVSEVVQLPPYLPHVVQAMRALGTLASTAGASEAMWAKITVPEHLKGASVGWDKLTEEESAYIIANGGKLPPHVTLEQLRARV